MVAAGEPFPADRCEANKAAGTITYLSSFDFAASASIVEVLVAKQKGYFDDLCLDVEVKPSFSTDNYPLIAANEAQFSSGGSFSEVVDYAGRQRRRVRRPRRRRAHRHRRPDRQGRPEHRRSPT